MSEETLEVILAVVVLSIVFGFGLLVGGIREKKLYQKQAIEKDYAEFNPINGVWQWKDKK